MSARPIAVVAHDPGAGSALEPVCRELSRTRPVVVLTHPLSAAALPDGEVIEALSTEAARAWIAAHNAAAVLLGTSMAPDSLDKRLLRAAHDLAVPSISFVDFWSNYEARFRDETGARLLPSWIAVPDSIARDEMMASGFPRDRLISVGLPRISASAPPDPVQARCALRALLPTSLPQALIVGFVSQSLEEIYGSLEASRAHIGYGQSDAARMLAHGLSRWRTRTYRPVCVFVRPHPKEGDAILSQRIWGEIPVIDARQLPADTFLAGCDIVAGMTGSMLLDAYGWKRPVISVQPGLIPPDKLVLSRAGKIPCARSEVEIASALENALSKPPTIDESFAPLFDGGAATRLARLVLDCAL